jgi:hypothetical protein
VALCIGLADILRLNLTQLQCKRCQQAFDSTPDKEDRKGEESEPGGTLRMERSWDRCGGSCIPGFLIRFTCGYCTAT